MACASERVPAREPAKECEGHDPAAPDCLETWRLRRPILFPVNSVTQMEPRASTVMPLSPLCAVGTGKVLKSPPGVIRAMRFPSYSVNHRLPSSPAMIILGDVLASLTVYSVTSPDVETRPIRLPRISVNHRASCPSPVAGPAVRRYGWLWSEGTG